MMPKMHSFIIYSIIYFAGVSRQLCRMMGRISDFCVCVGNWNVFEHLLYRSLIYFQLADTHDINRDQFQFTSMQMVFRVIGLYEILNSNNGYMLSIWGFYPWSGICISLWEYAGLCSLERPWALPIMEFMGPDSPALAICPSRSRNETGALSYEGYSWNFSLQ